MKGMTERQISMVMWITVAVIAFILIIAAGLFFFNKIPIQGALS